MAESETHMRRSLSLRIIVNLWKSIPSDKSRRDIAQLLDEVLSKHPDCSRELFNQVIELCAEKCKQCPPCDYSQWELIKSLAEKELSYFEINCK